MKRGLLVLAMVFTLVGYATAEPITGPSQLSPNPIEEVELTDLGPVGGAYASWIGFKRPSADISKVIMEAARSPAADFFAVDNIHYNTIQSCVQPPSGLVSWLPLDEVNGTTTPDIIGGNDGTLINAPIQVVGKVADALSFDGIDDYVDLGSYSSLDIPGSVTIDAWVRFMGFVGSQWYGYFVADFGPGGWISQLSLGIWGSGENFQFYAYEGRSSSDNTYVYSSADKTKGQWYHVAVVRDDATKTIKLYVNGNIEASESYAGKEPVSLQGHKYLGSSSPSFGDYFNGDLDEVEIYNRALSDAEIQSIYLAGSAGKCKSLTVTIDIKPGSYPTVSISNPRV